MLLKLANRKVEFPKCLGLYPGPLLQGERRAEEGRAGQGRTGREGEGRRVGPPTFETLPPPLHTAKIYVRNLN